ncbi:MOSC domain-containing protein [Stenotrophobium rhamnosiphilum]|uniref:Sulfurase n=1 Tax=Stenotrophobium rhamnosiphilum TaxID=2029166 RepID=A0A2T5MJX3_9GAMM|nr:MOSC domain-containing protein [Stenotrophobium rhamnosiphilum]PTU32864.1 sulfurase [Stenotrophobium rhamnosiphilum]
MIETIFVASEKASPQIEVSEIALVAGKGIVGDRNFNRSRWPGQNITFIEAEEIEAFNAKYKRSLSVGETRRNIITRSVRLNDLVGKSFQIGEVEFYGVELCEPCKKLGDLLATREMQSHAVVNAWIRKAGLRANVMTNGILRVGMNFADIG